MDIANKQVQFFDAVNNNDREKIRRLIEEDGIDVNDPDEDNFTRNALHLAALHGHTEIVRMLVEEYHANYNFEDQLGSVPLHIAADNGHMDIVNYLLEKKSNYSDDVLEFLSSQRCRANADTK